MVNCEIKKTSAILFVIFALSGAHIALGGHSLDYEEMFESYTNGFDMAGVASWEAPAGAAVVTTNQGTIASYGSSCGYPNDISTHTRALDLNGWVTNAFSTSTGQVIWLDQMVLADRQKTPGTDELDSSQAAVD